MSTALESRDWTSYDPDLCPECQWPTHWDGLLGHSPDGCAIKDHWDALRPAKPSMRVGQASEDDLRWFADHPDENVRVREMTTEEQLARFLAFGAAVTHAQVLRSWEEQEYGYGPGRVTRLVEKIRVVGIW